MKFLIALATIILLLYQLSIAQSKKGDNKKDVIELKRKKTAIEKYLFKHRKDIIVLVKVYGKKKLVKVKNENWPEETDIIYNVLKDSTGRIVLISKMPYSQSGDWYLGYEQYFDDKSKTFAFSDAESVFDDTVKDGIVRRDDLFYYNDKFQLIYKLNSLTGLKGMPIKRNVNEFNFHNEKGVVYKNVDVCLKAYGLLKYISTVK